MIWVCKCYDPPALRAVLVKLPPPRAQLVRLPEWRVNEESKRSTNPIWRFTPVFGQLASCNGKTKLVVVDNGEAGRKSDGWSMNLKRAAREGQSSAEAGVWRWARCSDICARGVRQLKLRVADLDWWRSVSPRDLKRCPSLQRPTWRSCWPGDAGSE
jgi:hypothetical protein